MPSTGLGRKAFLKEKYSLEEDDAFYLAVYAETFDAYCALRVAKCSHESAKVVVLWGDSVYIKRYIDCLEYWSDNEELLIKIHDAHPDEGLIAARELGEQGSRAVLTLEQLLVEVNNGVEPSEVVIADLGIDSSDFESQFDV